MNDDHGETGLRDDAPRPEPDTSNTESSDSLLHRFLHADDGVLLFVREVLVSVSAVVALGLLLYTISGVWPPMVAVESGSMEPHMYRGDLVFITAPDRFTPDYGYEDTGVVTVDIGSQEGYRSFGGSGSVVVYDPPSRFGSPIIHRAHFYVEEGENWYDEANPDYLNAENCEQLRYCPAPHAGFITKGDANAHYDQASGIAEPVKTEWVEGVAHVRVPYLGYVRLELAGSFLPTAVPAASADSTASGAANPSADSGPSVAGESTVSLAGESTASLDGESGVQSTSYPPRFESTPRTVGVA